MSPDEVRLVDHACLQAAADADEDASIQPGELAGRGLDLRGGAKGVLARIDILAAAETFENLRAAVPHRIADAVLFLANQDARSATHELQLTPLAENWTP